MRWSALKTSKLSALANTDGVDLILNGHSPVFHEIERVEDIKAVSPGQHWLDLLLNGLTCFP
jgi:hypothetical protein